MRVFSRLSSVPTGPIGRPLKVRKIAPVIEAREERSSIPELRLDLFERRPLSEGASSGHRGVTLLPAFCLCDVMHARLPRRRSWVCRRIGERRGGADARPGKKIRFFVCFSRTFLKLQSHRGPSASTQCHGSLRHAAGEGRLLGKVSKNVTEQRCAPIHVSRAGGWLQRTARLRWPAAQTSATRTRQWKWLGCLPRISIPPRPDVTAMVDTLSCQAAQLGCYPGSCKSALRYVRTTWDSCMTYERGRRPDEPWCSGDASVMLHSLQLLAGQGTES